METVGSTRLGRASSRYGTPTVFSGPVRKWEKKWVHVTSSLNNNNNNNNNNANSHSKNDNNNNNASSRLLLRRWTPITAPSSATTDENTHNGSGDVSDEPPRRRFRYTPIAVLEEQKKGAVEKAEHEPITESEQLTPRQTNETHEVHGKLNMNEILEDTKDSNMSKLDLDLSFQGNNGENNQNSDDQLEEKYPVGGP